MSTRKPRIPLTLGLETILSGKSLAFHTFIVHELNSLHVCRGLLLDKIQYFYGIGHPEENELEIRY